MNNSVKSYLAGVRRSLHCPRNAKKEIMNRLQGDISDYLQDIPNPTQEELFLQFGVPEEYARESLELYDSKSLNEKLNVRKKTMNAIIAVGVVAITIITAVSIYAIIGVARAKLTEHGYSVITVHEP